jgi:hypothetical protein
MQNFEKFVGLPEDLIAKLEEIKDDSGTIVSVIVSHVAATYIIIWESAA